jgi:hypothetical protein
MRSIITYFALIAIFVWMASEGGFDRVDRGHLPIANSRAPTYISDLPLPDPHDLNDIAVVPAAQAAGAWTPTRLTVTGSVVNMRAGPGLGYRMIDVLDRGAEIMIEGVAIGDWLPVIDPLTGVSAWIHSDYVVRTVLD